MINPDRRFIDLDIPDRVCRLLEKGDSDDIHQLLVKHLGESLEIIKIKYKITVHTVRRRIFISGNPIDIAELFLYLNKFGMTFESVTATELRIDVNAFCQELK